MGSLDPARNLELSAKDAEFTDDKHSKRQKSNMYIWIYRKKN